MSALDSHNLTFDPHSLGKPLPPPLPTGMAAPPSVVNQPGAVRFVGDTRQSKRFMGDDEVLDPAAGREKAARAYKTLHANKTDIAPGSRQSEKTVHDADKRFAGELDVHLWASGFRKTGRKGLERQLRGLHHHHRQTLANMSKKNFGYFVDRCEEIARAHTRPGQEMGLHARRSLERRMKDDIGKEISVQDYDDMRDLFATLGIDIRSRPHW